MRYWPGAQWRKNPSPSMCLVCKLELLGLCATQGSSCVPYAWVLAGMSLLDWPSAPPASLPGCSQLSGCPLNLHAPPWGSGTAGLVPSNLLDEAASKVAIQDFIHGQGSKRTNSSFLGSPFWAVQKTSLFTSRTPFASPSLSSPSKCHRFLSCSCSRDITSPPEK